MATNPLHQAIYSKIVQPALSKIAYDVEATIVNVSYFDQKVDAYFVDEQQQRRTIKGLHLPKDADGIYRQAVYPGDKVRIAFKGGNHSLPYIVMIYKFSSQTDYFSKKGAGIPKGIGYI